MSLNCVIPFDFLNWINSIFNYSLWESNHFKIQLISDLYNRLGYMIKRNQSNTMPWEWALSKYISQSEKTICIFGLRYITQGRFVIEIYMTGHTNDNTQLWHTRHNQIQLAFVIALSIKNKINMRLGRNRQRFCLMRYIQ